jgi:glycosyltransferase involved in cell wall biosynthesis
MDGAICQMPLVSVILATRDRPRLLPLALECYSEQTYPNRELIVVDDGAIAPADSRLVAEAGGRLFRLDPNLFIPIGTKLNYGVQEARGTLCQKMDDDDWYAPHFLEAMVSALIDCGYGLRPRTLACLSPWLVFDLGEWTLRRTPDGVFSGATLIFARQDWKVHPFRDIPGNEDYQFLWDQAAYGVGAVYVQGIEAYVTIRHDGAQGQRGHMWHRGYRGLPLQEEMQAWPVHHRPPESFLPERALKLYRELRGITPPPLAATAGVAGWTPFRPVQARVTPKS